MFRTMTLGRAVRALAAIALLVGVGFAAQGCGSSASLTNVWSDPSYTGGKLHKVFVISALQNTGTRRSTEDVASAEIKKRGVEAISSYTVFPDSLPSKEVVKDYLLSNNYDGVIINRITGKDQRSYYVPPTATTVAMPTYGGWYGWYGGMYNTYYSPGYTETENLIYLDTSVWVPGDPGKLVWAGTTELVDPSSANGAAKQISDMVLPRLEKMGLF